MSWVKIWKNRNRENIELIKVMKSEREKTQKTMENSFEFGNPRKTKWKTSKIFKIDNRKFKTTKNLLIVVMLTVDKQLAHNVEELMKKNVGEKLVTYLHFA